VLLVEDSELNRKLMRRQLESIDGTRVSEAPSATDALDLLERQDVDLLVADIHMPGMSGLDLIRTVRIRERTLGTRLPIVVVSASGREEEGELALKAGADCLLPKPFRTEEVRVVLEALVAANLTGCDRQEMEG
jgi:CheY-like chemotaxis protein